MRQVFVRGSWNLAICAIFWTPVSSWDKYRSEQRRLKKEQPVLTWAAQKLAWQPPSRPKPSSNGFDPFDTLDQQAKKSILRHKN